MQQFAIAAMAPRSIAWLVHQDDWAHMETIVAYNCALLGGYFNAFIPMTSHDMIDQDYEQFLIDYDPDLIALAPGMSVDALTAMLKRDQRVDPFGIVPWDAVPLIASLDPRYTGMGMNAPAPAEAFAASPLSYVAPTLDPGPLKVVKVAAADAAYPDTSRLALIACGDLAPATSQGKVDISGVRERFLHGVIGFDNLHRKLGITTATDPSVNEPYTDPHTQMLHASPPREHLSDLVAPNQQFPLTDACRILEACFHLQWNRKETLVGRTVPYDEARYVEDTWTYHWARRGQPRPPGVVVLMSEHFGVEEAALFWNLRACSIFVAWLPLAEAQHDPAALADWLAASEGGAFYAELQVTEGIAFGAPQSEIDQVRTLYDAIATAIGDRLPHDLSPFGDLVAAYGSSNRPAVSRDHVNLTTSESTCSLLPTVPSDSTGVYTVTLLWDDLMLPRSHAIIPRLIARDQGRVVKRVIGGQEMRLPLRTFRTTDSRYLRAQYENGDALPVTFHVPNATQIVEVIATADTGFSRLDASSVANYHRHFIQCAGGLEEAVYYLATSPYKELLALLADTGAQRGKRGRVLDHPQKRRILHHFDLCAVLGEPVDASTEGYFQSLRTGLPAPAVELLQKGIIERGLELTCRSCRYTSWYPLDQVGREFRCACCYEVQAFVQNPPWVYKLPEVIFLGVTANMRVPLLTLNYIKQHSRRQFDYVLDSDLYIPRDDVKPFGNLDVICLCDGLLCVGEAKSKDEISQKQLRFYAKLLQTIPIDCLVVATSAPAWKSGTDARITELTEQWGNMIISLTGPELDEVAQRMASNRARVRRP